MTATLTYMNKVIHKEDCRRVFKNYDMTCDRCKELAEGSEPRKAWFEPRKPVSYRSECSHGASNLNPGGYCNICGNGRDFS